MKRLNLCQRIIILFLAVPGNKLHRQALLSSLEAGSLCDALSHVSRLIVARLGEIITQESSLSIHIDNSTVGFYAPARGTCMARPIVEDIHPGWGVKMLWMPVSC